MKIYIVSKPDTYKFFSNKREAVRCAKEDYHLAIKEGRNYWWADSVYCFECTSTLMQVRIMALLKDFFGALSQELTPEERDAIEHCVTEIPIATNRMKTEGDRSLRNV